MSKTITAIAQTEKSSKSLTAIIATLVKTMAEMATTATAHTEVVYEIEVAQNELDLILTNTASKERQASAELAISILENEGDVLTSLLNKNGLAKIDADDLVLLRTRLDDALESNATEVSKAVKAAESSCHAGTSAQLSAAKGAHAVDVAQKDADLKAKDMQISFMTAIDAKIKLLW